MTNNNLKNKANRLINEKSLYLLQHAYNPVDWYKWGEEAFKKALKEDKPVFLSSGYSTCHWCHVMAHESFSDTSVADILNKYFISIKLDREERPDIDQLYMGVCQILTGSGGWPLSIFMTPDKKPFYAGTYFPKISRMGMPGFIDILNQLNKLWITDRPKIVDIADKLTQAIQVTDSNKNIKLNKDVLKKAFLQLESAFDNQWGGFGHAPKFPTPHQLNFLLRYYKRIQDITALKMVEKTLQAMRSGGIFDHIGHGYHRYSVDDKWLVPHFEKMLYDQALIAISYIEAFQITKNPLYAMTIDEVFKYIIRDMTSPEGGFYSSEDADSQGVEGKFYVWKHEEIKRLLKEDKSDVFCDFYNITKNGNFENGLSILNTPVSLEKFAKSKGMAIDALKIIIRDSCNILFSERKKREHPLKDNKIIISWNGLMISAFSRAYQLFDNDTYLEKAKDAADFILKNLKQDKFLFRCFIDGNAEYSGFLEDYSFFVQGLIDLYESTFNIKYLKYANELTCTMIQLFWDKEGGGFSFSGEANEKLIAKTKDIYDGAIPSGNSIAILNLLRLGKMFGNIEFEEKAHKMCVVFSEQILKFPRGFTSFLSAVDFIEGHAKEIIIVGCKDKTKNKEFIKTIYQMFLPNKVLLFKPTGAEGKELDKLVPFVSEMSGMDDQPVVYICEKYSCKSPVSDIDSLKKAISLKWIR